MFEVDIALEGRMTHIVGWFFFSFNSDDNFTQQDGKIVQLHDKNLVSRYLQSNTERQWQVENPEIYPTLAPPRPIIGAISLWTSQWVSRTAPQVTFGTEGIHSREAGDTLLDTGCRGRASWHCTRLITGCCGELTVGKGWSLGRNKHGKIETQLDKRGWSCMKMSVNLPGLPYTWSAQPVLSSYLIPFLTPSRVRAFYSKCLCMYGVWAQQLSSGDALEAPCVWDTRKWCECGYASVIAG